MSQHQLPTGCHDANSAAQLLKMSKRALLQRMRELGWLLIGGDSHNLPRQEYIRNGFLSTQERGYGLRGKMEISKSYRVMILTQKGFQALKEALNNTVTKAEVTASGNAHASAKNNGAIATSNQQEMDSPAPGIVEPLFNREKSEQAHQEYLKSLAEIGIPVSRAS